MIENRSQFLITLKQLGSLIEGLEDLHRTVLPQSASLFAVAAEAVMEDIRRLRQELQDYSTGLKVAG